MNRKQKIIVSITGIFIVLLALVGLTYAYFLTRITGNENDKSISVTTANLELVYGDDDGSIIGDGEIIEPGKTFETKTFTVTNNGNTKIDDYAVILEDVSTTYASTFKEGNNTIEAGTPVSFKRPEDFEIIITCSSLKKGATTPTECIGYNGTLPLIESTTTEETYITNGILTTNAIEVGEVQTYSVILEYVEADTDQSADMNKKLEGKLNIIDTKNTVDITGIVDDFDLGDKIVTNSTRRESQINSDGSYKIIGLEAGIHSIKLNETEISKLSIMKGETASVGETTYNGETIKQITITDDSRITNVNISDSELNIGTIEKYNPFKEGTLAYKIFDSATSNESGKTKYVSNPSTPIGSEFDYEKSYTVIEGEFNQYSIPSGTEFTCYDSYTVDDEKGVFILNGETKCSPEPLDGISNGPNKYVVFNKDLTGVSSLTSSDFISTNEATIVYLNPTSFVDAIGLVKYTLSENIENPTKELSKTTDNDGPTYYFRGMPEDNYVNFAGKCWRIVRIQGDGSVKLILEDDSQTCSSNMDRNSYLERATYPFNYNYIYENEEICNEGMIPNFSLNVGMTITFKNFQTNINNYLDRLKEEKWCWGPEGMSKSSLKCNDNIIDKFSDNSKMYVGTITYSEAQFAGSYSRSLFSNNTYYLISDYMREQNIAMWTMTTSEFPTCSSYRGYAIGIGNGLSSSDTLYTKYSGDVNENWLETDYHVRPAVVLRKGITATGSGTITDPYKIG